jgi:hypothetical protein
MVGLSAATKCNKKVTSCHEFAKKWLNLKVFLFCLAMIFFLRYSHFSTAKYFVAKKLKMIVLPPESFL